MIELVEKSDKEKIEALRIRVTDLERNVNLILANRAHERTDKCK